MTQDNGRGGWACLCVKGSLWAAALCSSALGAEGINPLRNSYYHLSVEKRLTVGYFGGSITAGSGASKPDSGSWRALTDAWLRKAFPAAAIASVNAAIGGTGSDLGAFRLRRDLLDTDPDLVFVEFAVNDGGKGRAIIAPCMDGIVRQIRAKNPQAEIIFIYTTSKSLAQAYDAGKVPPAVGFDQEVADHYAIPSVNVGVKIWEEIHAGRETWDTMLPDGTHPNDKGHHIYAMEVQAFLAAHLAGAAPSGPFAYALPAALVPNSVQYGELADSWTLNAPGWAKQDSSIAGRYPHRIAANTPGTELHYAFRGSAIGVYWLVGPESGDVQWSVDGSAPVRVSSWDTYALPGYKRAFNQVFSLGLDGGPHNLTLKVLAEKNAQSLGTWIQIGAMLVNAPAGSLAVHGGEDAGHATAGGGEVAGAFAGLGNRTGKGMFAIRARQGVCDARGRIAR